MSILQMNWTSWSVLFCFFFLISADAFKSEESEDGDDEIEFEKDVSSEEIVTSENKTEKREETEEEIEEEEEDKEENEETVSVTESSHSDPKEENEDEQGQTNEDKQDEENGEEEKRTSSPDQYDRGDEDDKGEDNNDETTEENENAEGNEDEKPSEEKEEKMATDSETELSNPDENEATAETTKAESVWSYYGPHGPGNWSKVFSGCDNRGLRLQSPIDINAKQTEFRDDQLDAIELLMDNKDNLNTTIIHNHHTVKLSFDKVIRIDGLGRTYRVNEVQFHWGDTDDTGSEHSIDGKRYPLEMQIFAYDEDEYMDFENAVRNSENNHSTTALIILATLFQLSETDNPHLAAITENLESVMNPGDRVTVDSFMLKDLLPKKTDYYFRYTGSFTFPPCTAGAEWIIFNEKQMISLPQLQQFRQLYEEQKTSPPDPVDATRIAFNWRPVQPLNGRVVVRSFPIEDPLPPPLPPLNVNQQLNPEPPESVVGNPSGAALFKIKTTDYVFIFTLLVLLKAIMK